MSYLIKNVFFAVLCLCFIANSNASTRRKQLDDKVEKIIGMSIEAAQASDAYLEIAKRIGFSGNIETDRKLAKLVASRYADLTVYTKVFDMQISCYFCDEKQNNVVYCVMLMISYAPDGRCNSISFARSIYSASADESADGHSR
jgi:hypothetical protein